MRAIARVRRHGVWLLMLPAAAVSAACGRVWYETRQFSDAGDRDGALPPGCGDGLCQVGETAKTCVADCGRCPARPATMTALETTLFDLPADTWYELPASKMEDVCVPDSVGVRGVVGCASVIIAWSGGTYDAARSRLLLWGGGPENYFGNELYAFDVRSGTWSRLTEPTVDMASAGTDPLPDGSPGSRQSFDLLEVVTHSDTLFSHGGGVRNTWSNVSWAYDLVSGGWTNRRPTVAGPYGGAWGTAYDLASRSILMRANEALYVYDYDGNTWSSLADFALPPLWPRYSRDNVTAAIDPTRRLLWSVGGGDIFVWDIAQREPVTDDWVTTGGGAYSNAAWTTGYAGQLFESGGGDVYNADAPGFDYDQAADALVAWANGGGPYALDLAAKNWTRGSGAGAPTSLTQGGTFGRWRYIPAYNVFILVTAIDDNVHFYKHVDCP